MTDNTTVGTSTETYWYGEDEPVRTVNTSPSFENAESFEEDFGNFLQADEGQEVIRREERQAETERQAKAAEIEAKRQITIVKKKEDFFKKAKLGGLIITTSRGDHYGVGDKGIITQINRVNEEVHVGLIETTRSGLTLPYSSIIHYSKLNFIEPDDGKFSAKNLFPIKINIYKTSSMKVQLAMIKAMEEIESVVQKTEEDAKILLVTTKPLIKTRYREKHNIGAYQMKIYLDAPRPGTSTQLWFKRIEGSVEVNNEGNYFYNPFMNESNEPMSDFTTMCYGSDHPLTTKALRSKDYMTIVELAISNMLSDSSAGFCQWTEFLNAIDNSTSTQSESVYGTRMFSDRD